MKKRLATKIAVLIVLSMVFALMLSVVPNNNAKASMPFSEEDIVKRWSCTFNGTKRTLYILPKKVVYFQINDEEPFRINTIPKTALDFGLDDYGTVWYVDQYEGTDYIIKGWNYDLCKDPTFYAIPGVTDAFQLIYDNAEDELVHFYTLVSSSIEYPLLTFDELKALKESLNSPSPEPTKEPAETKKPVETKKPANINKPDPGNKTIKADNKISVRGRSLYRGKKLLGTYSLKKGILKYDRSGKKVLKYKGVKKVGGYSSTGSLVFCQKNKIYGISLNGKKKLLLKKGFKKFYKEKKFVKKIIRTKGNKPIVVK